jgi:L-lysine exporter family protein LysE/ArgO
MLHHFILGLLLGWGAAIPIGPMNLEIIRRNLQLGTRFGVALGLGACSADVTYIILLSLGALTLLNHLLILRILGIVGSLLLAWFGYSALRMKIRAIHVEAAQKAMLLPWRHLIEGYFLTLINPFTVLFWLSVSSQIALATTHSSSAAFHTGIGVMLATVSWITGLNTLLHFTRHRLPERTMHWLNITGGLILIAFAIMGLWRAL